MDIEVESELRGVVPKNYVSMPDEYWKSKLSLEEIFNDLHSSKEAIIMKLSNTPDHMIQKYLILDQVPQLMEIIEDWIDSDQCRPQFLRFLAHLVLFLRQIGKIGNQSDKVGDKVLLAYVKLLIEIGEPTLVAFYTATLQQEEQVTYYAQYLERITGTEMRKQCLAAAEDANLNVEAVTKMVVENIRGKNVEDVDKLEMLGSKITEYDLEKIDALEWMTFYPNQREEALWQANALIRYFLTCDKIDAARQAFDKVSYFYL